MCCFALVARFICRCFKFFFDIICKPFAREKSEIHGKKPKRISDVKPEMEAKKGSKTSGKIKYDPDVSTIVEQLHKQGFLDTEKITFIVHGFSGDMEDVWMKDIQDSMVDEDPTQTVVRFDWKRGAAVDLGFIWDWLLAAFGKRIQAIEPQAKFGSVQTKTIMSFGTVNEEQRSDPQLFSAQNKLDDLKALRAEISSHKKFIDWLWIYHTAAATTQSVGEWLGDVAKSIKEQQPIIQIQGVGHSLGAHLLGKAGRSSGAFSRITGLDPAGPDFEEPDGARDKMLSESDADLVDVIHTNGSDESLLASIFPVHHFGTLIPLGDVDFYPNYGAEQPGCWAIGHNHFRVLDYFDYSIQNPDAFTTNQVLDGTPGYENPVKKTKSANRQMGYHNDHNSNRHCFMSVTPEEVPIKYTIRSIIFPRI